MDQYGEARIEQSRKDAKYWFQMALDADYRLAKQRLEDIGERGSD